MSEHAMSRRALIGAATTALSYSRIYGANQRLGLGLIGCGERGRYDMSNFVKTGDVDVVALCDIWPKQFEAAAKDAPSAKRFGHHPDLLAMKEVDIALIATPDHWHVPIAIDALNAGKDVYVEKPLTLTPEEGPAVVKAARINSRICQVGMQQRSGQHYLQAKAEYFDTGKIGKLTLARTWWHGNGYHLRKAPDSLREKPQDLDWARYLGRRRPGDRSVHPLDRRGTHVHRAGDPIRGGGAGRRVQL
jgi:predicted dehydrogenase